MQTLRRTLSVKMDCSRLTGPKFLTRVEQLLLTGLSCTLHCGKSHRLNLFLSHTAPACWGEPL